MLYLIHRKAVIGEVLSVREVEVAHQEAVEELLRRECIESATLEGALQCFQECINPDITTSKGKSYHILNGTHWCQLL